MLSSNYTNFGRLIFFCIPFTASNIEFLGPGPSRSLGRYLAFMPPMAPMVPNASIRGTNIWIKVLAVSYAVGSTNGLEAVWSITSAQHTTTGITESGSSCNMSSSSLVTNWLMALIPDRRRCFRVSVLSKLSPLIPPNRLP